MRQDTPALTATRPRVQPFLLIGAQKSGTSFLFNILARDPAIAVAARKEPMIFSKPCHDDVPFLSFFDAGPGHRFALDGSASYLHVPGTARQVASRLGTDLPVVAVLRDPAERAISGYLHELKHGRDMRGPDEAFDVVAETPAATIALEQRRIEAAWKAGRLQPHNAPAHRYRDPFFQFRYVRNSLYSGQLAEWEAFARLSLVDFADLRADPHRVVAAIRRGAGLPPGPTHSGDAPRNDTNVTLRRALRQNRALAFDHRRPGWPLAAWRLWRAMRPMRGRRFRLDPRLADMMARDFDACRARYRDRFL